MPESSALPPPNRDSRDLRDLALRASHGDSEALKSLHDRLDGGVRRFFARRIGTTRHALDELSQRTWVAVWQSLNEHRYDPTLSAISTYVYAVAYKIWLQWCRRHSAVRASTHAIDDLALQLIDRNRGPGDAMHAAELIDAMRECLEGGLAGLLSEERMVVEGMALGLTERELAARIKVAPSTVNARKRAGLAKLRRCMASKGFGAEFAEHDEGSRE